MKKLNGQPQDRGAPEDEDEASAYVDEPEENASGAGAKRDEQWEEDPPRRPQAADQPRSPRRLRTEDATAREIAGLHCRMLEDLIFSSYDLAMDYHDEARAIDPNVRCRDRLITMGSKLVGDTAKLIGVLDDHRKAMKKF